MRLWLLCLALVPGRLWSPGTWLRAHRRYRRTIFAEVRTFDSTGYTGWELRP